MIVFDLDGTLINSSRDLTEAASELVQGYGAAPLSEAEVAGMVGEGARVLVERALVHSGLDPETPGAIDRFMAIYDRRLLDHTVPYEGMHEVLALLLRIGPLAVLTNKPAGLSERILDELGLRGFFSLVLGGDGANPRKPDPTALRGLAASAIGATTTTMVGDSPIDAATARGAGCRFVLAAYGFGAVKFEGHVPGGARVVHHPRELVSLVDTLTLDAARMPIVIR
jgi:phosphoglycolate phosphatase